MHNHRRRRLLARSRVKIIIKDIVVGEGERYIKKSKKDEKRYFSLFLVCIVIVAGDYNSR